METNTLLLMGFGFYALSRSSQTGSQNNGGSNTNQIDTSYIQTIGQPPAANTPAWTDWIKTAINVYGVVAPLWAPGRCTCSQPRPRSGNMKGSKHPV